MPLLTSLISSAHLSGISFASSSSSHSWWLILLLYSAAATRGTRIPIYIRPSLLFRLVASCVATDHLLLSGNNVSITYRSPSSLPLHLRVYAADDDDDGSHIRTPRANTEHSIEGNRAEDNSILLLLLTIPFPMPLTSPCLLHTREFSDQISGSGRTIQITAVLFPNRTNYYYFCLYFLSCSRHSACHSKSLNYQQPAPLHIISCDEKETMCNSNRPVLTPVVCTIRFPIFIDFDLPPFAVFDYSTAPASQC